VLGLVNRIHLFYLSWMGSALLPRSLQDWWRDSFLCLCAGALVWLDKTQDSSRRQIVPAGEEQQKMVRHVLERVPTVMHRLFCVLFHDCPQAPARQAAGHCVSTACRPRLFQCPFVAFPLVGPVGGPVGKRNSTINRVAKCCRRVGPR